MSTRAVRERVVELCHDLVARGYFAATGGNVALRIDADLFAVTPSATDYYSMQFTDVSVLRMADLRQIEAKQLRAKLLSVWVDPQRRASRASAFVIQSGIFVWNASLW